MRVTFLFAALFSLSVAAEAGHRPLPVKPRLAPVTEENVSYYGGPVISRVKVELVFWGEGVEAGTQRTLATFYRALTGSSYLDQFAEYATNIRAVDGRPGTNQTIGRGTLSGVRTIRPVNTSHSLTQEAVEAELEAQFSNGGLPKPDPDTLYMLHFPDGYTISISFGQSCVSWLADHEVYKSKKYGNAYYAMFPCDSADSSNLSTLTFAASHELTEAITDPSSPLMNEAVAYPTGWIRPDGEEIADLCMGPKATLTTPSAVYTISANWLNSLRGCKAGDFR